MKKIFVIIGLIIAVVGVDYLRDRRLNQEIAQTENEVEQLSDDGLEEEKVHYHAGFIVYVDGERIDFSDFKYMHLEPCGEEHEESDPEHEQEEKAHLHDGVGDVVHVHREGAVWGDLFENIGYEVDWDRVSVYLNGQSVEDIQRKSIEPDESVLIVIGEVDGIDLDTFITLERIREVESMSESCGE